MDIEVTFDLKFATIYVHESMLTSSLWWFNLYGEVFEVRFFFSSTVFDSFFNMNWATFIWKLNMQKYEKPLTFVV